jgi:hypothetical protein
MPCGASACVDVVNEYTRIGDSCLSTQTIWEVFKAEALSSFPLPAGSMAPRGTTVAIRHPRGISR